MRSTFYNRSLSALAIIAASLGAVMFASEKPPARPGAYDGESVDGWRWNDHATAWQIDPAATVSAVMPMRAGAYDGETVNGYQWSAGDAQWHDVRAGASLAAPAARPAGVAATSAAADLAAGKPVDAAAELTRAAEVIRQLTAQLEAERKIRPAEAPPVPGIDHTQTDAGVLALAGYERIGDGSEFSPHIVRPTASKWD